MAGAALGQPLDIKVCIDWAQKQILALLDRLGREWAAKKGMKRGHTGAGNRVIGAGRGKPNTVDKEKEYAHSVDKMTRWQGDKATMSARSFVWLFFNVVFIVTV